MRIQVDGVHMQLDGQPILRGCDLAVEAGEMVGIVGPNGSGKSTLLRAIYRALRPVAGWVRLDQDDVWALSARASAQRTAVLAQENPSAFDFSVEEVVAMGRIPHKSWLERESASDRHIVSDALARVGASNLSHRIFASLSGGEKQRVLLARTLAQGSRVLVLDEPTNHLDISAALELLELVRGVDVTIVAALHELNLAAAYCDRICLLSAGVVVRTGTPGEVLTGQLLEQVFKVSAHAGVHPLTGRLHLAFAPLAQNPEPTAGPGASSTIERTTS